MEAGLEPQGELPGFSPYDAYEIRERLERCEKRDLAMRTIMEGLQKEGLVLKQGGEIESVKVHATGVVQNPHDPDAQWSAKGQGKQRKEWVGYKVQVAETVASQGDQNSFISSVVTQRATESDDAGLPATLQKQESLGFDRPAELYVDGAYISGRVIDQAKEEGWQLMGPAQPSASRAGLEKAYRIEAFDISSWEPLLLSSRRCRFERGVFSGAF
jgi:hypothetical protein